MDFYLYQIWIKGILRNFENNFFADWSSLIYFKSSSHPFAIKEIMMLSVIAVNLAHIMSPSLQIFFSAGH